MRPAAAARREGLSRFRPSPYWIVAGGLAALFLTAFVVVSALGAPLLTDPQDALGGSGAAVLGVALLVALLAALGAPALGLRKVLDYRSYGGAPLLGVDGVVIISHGRSNERAIASAIGVAKQSVEGDVPETIARLMATLESTPQPVAASD